MEIQTPQTGIGEHENAQVKPITTDKNKRGIPIRERKRERKEPKERVIKKENIYINKKEKYIKKKKEYQ